MVSLRKKIQRIKNIAKSNIPSKEKSRLVYQQLRPSSKVSSMDHGGGDPDVSPKGSKKQKVDLDTKGEVVVEWTNPEGETKRTITKNPENTLNQIHDMGGRAKSVYERDKTGRKGKKIYTFNYEEREPRFTPQEHYKRAIPWEIRGSGTEDKYAELRYRVHKGEITPEEAERRYNRYFDLNVSESWVKEHGKFIMDSGAKTFTWNELKASEPALYLTKGSSGWQTSYNPVRWQKEQGESEIPVGYSGLALQKEVSKILMPANEFVDWFSATASGDFKKQERVEAESQYRYSQAWKKGDYLGVGGRALSSIPAIAATSYGIGVVIGKLSTVSPKLGLGAKVGLFAGSTVYTGYQMKKTFESKGWAGIKKSMGTLMVTLPVSVFAYKTGYTKGTGGKPIPKTNINLKFKTLKSGAVEISKEKYLFRTGNKMFGRYHYKKVTMTPDQAWYFRQAYASKGKVWAGTEFQTRLPEFTKTRTDYLSYKPHGGLTYTSSWGNKLFVETGEGWQPKTGIRNLPGIYRAQMLPHPRAYETHFFFVDWTPYMHKKLGWDISIKNKPVVGLKKPYYKTAKDILKSDTKISEETGFKPVSSGQKQQTIQLQRQQYKTVQKQKVEQVLKLDTKQDMLSLLKSDNKFKQLSKIIQGQKSKSALLYGQSQRYSFVSVQKSMSVQNMRQLQIQKQSYVFKQSQRQRQGFMSMQAMKQSQKQRQAFMPALSFASVQLPAQIQASGVRMGFKSQSAFKFPSPTIKRTPNGYKRVNRDLDKLLSGIGFRHSMRKFKVKPLIKFKKPKIIKIKIPKVKI